MLSRKHLVEFVRSAMLEAQIPTDTIVGWKTCEIGVRQGANRNEVEHLMRIRNTAWRRFSSGFRQVIYGTAH